jgi:Domain of unknown function (DUF4105)
MSTTPDMGNPRHSVMNACPHRSPLVFRMVRGASWTIAWLLALGCAAWAFGALHYDFPMLHNAATWAFALALLAAIVFMRGAWRKLGTTFLGCALVLAWWLTLKPSNTRAWQPDVAQEPWAEVKGDEVTLHNVRNCDYRTETDYTPRWETRTVRLSQLTGIDLAINYWGSPWMAHPIASFQFANAPPLCFSIETRKEIGESYSAIGGFFRQFELIYVAADERDVIRVRTNFRNSEDVYLYRTTAPPEKARERFMDYIAALNELHAHPRWYNAATTNCTTSIRTQQAATQRAPWDWRILLNGKGDELMFERGALATGGLPFAELKTRALINSAAKAADATPDFSRIIRTGLPGF